jgi:hypothetical protein
MLGSNALFLRKVPYLTSVVLATMRIAQGEDVYAVLDSVAPDVREELIYAFDMENRRG